MPEVENQSRTGFDTLDEARLVAGILRRDLRAFEVLYEAYRPRLFRFLIIMIKRPLIAEEVLNDTMMVVWEKLDGFRGESALSTWIYAIAYRKGARALKRTGELRYEKEPADIPSPDADPEAMATQAHSARELAVAVGKLSSDHRAVVDLTYFHGLGYREIGEIMGCPVDTVKTRMFHARRHLRGLLSGDKTDWI